MKQIYIINFHAMGCAVNVQLESEIDGRTLLDALPAQLETLEDCLSRFRPHSELMRLNAQAGAWVAVSDTLFDNIHAAKQAAYLTDGLFNPLVLPAMLANGYDRTFSELNRPASSAHSPVANWRGIELRLASHEVRLPAGSALDLGGIAKGWTAAKIADQLSAYGACLVNIGGDMVGRGAPQNLHGWPVDIFDPHGAGSVASLSLRDACIVTSGSDYRRWTTSDGVNRHHILDPRTGESAQSDVLTVTVHHPHAPTAEAYAKAILILGAQAGLAWLQTQWDAAGLVVLQDSTVLASANFTDLLDEMETP